MSLTRGLSVDQCLKICGLDEYRDAAIGTCNVEIKKRTTIGVELAAKVSPPAHSRDNPGLNICVASPPAFPRRAYVRS